MMAKSNNINTIANKLTFGNLKLLLGPIIFAIMLIVPVPWGLSLQEWLAVACIAWMITWWIVEAVPIAVTALLPIVLFPLLGVAPIKVVTSSYAHPIIYLFLGGFMLAAAMEKWNLHKRIALTIILWVGTSSTRIIGGFMLATALLSMWISNTATTVMMLPIGMAVIDLLMKDKNIQADDKSRRNFAIALLLGLAYAANVGGTATLIGTPPNAIFAAFMNQNYNVVIDFATWMVIGVPFALVMLVICWFVLVKVMYPSVLKTEGNGARNIIADELKALGKMSKGEKIVGAVFACTALLWIMRSSVNQLIETMGWPIGEVTDAGIAIAATVLLFVIPVDAKKKRYAMDWQAAQQIPWGILLLFGGGLSIATTLGNSSIVTIVGEEIAALDKFGIVALIAVVTLAMLLLTELMSNMALTTLLLPVIAAIALQVGENPLLLAIPITLASSCAFMMPIATPPNAIVFASGHMHIPHMIKAGIVLNIVSIVLIVLWSQSIMLSAFDIEMGVLPEWLMGGGAN